MGWSSKYPPVTRGTPGPRSCERWPPHPPPTCHHHVPQGEKKNHGCEDIVFGVHLVMTAYRWLDFKDFWGDCSTKKPKTWVWKIILCSANYPENTVFFVCVFFWWGGKFWKTHLGGLYIYLHLHHKNPTIYRNSSRTCLAGIPTRKRIVSLPTIHFSGFFLAVSFREGNPWNPCMVYLRAFTIKINEM